MLLSTYTTLLPPLRQKQAQKQINLPCAHDPSAFVSFSLGPVSSAEVFIDATMGATAGAGVVDLLIFAACNL